MKDNCKYYFVCLMRNSVKQDFILLMVFLCFTLKLVDSITESSNQSVITNHNKTLKNSYVFMEWKKSRNGHFHGTRARIKDAVKSKFTGNSMISFICE